MNKVALEEKIIGVLKDQQPILVQDLYGLLGYAKNSFSLRKVISNLELQGIIASEMQRLGRGRGMKALYLVKRTRQTKPKKVDEPVKPQIKPYQIEKGIPIPPLKPGRTEKFPLDKMNVGDSFFIPMQDADGRNPRHSLSVRVRRLGFKITVRKVENGYRVWRTA